MAEEKKNAAKKEGPIEKLLDAAGGLDGLKDKAKDLLDKTDIDEKLIGKVKEKFK